jgi:Tfp pilus assembly protein PilF
MATLAALALGVRSRRELPPPAAPAAPAAPAVNTAGEQALSTGLAALSVHDLDGADQALARASALLPHDVRVAEARLRATTIRADESWMAARLLIHATADRRELAKARHRELTLRLRQVLDEASESGPLPPALVTDALRIEGSLESARALAATVSTPKKPEDAYARAMLEAAYDPLRPGVVDGLVAARAASDATLSRRATIALAWVHAVRGEAAARDVVASLAKYAHAVALLPDLRIFVDRALATPLVLAPKGASPLAVAHEALERGERARARKLLVEVLARTPDDVEALTMLAEIDAVDGALVAARKGFTHALAENPDYLPARIGLADLAWASGQNAQARALYAKILEDFPPGAYPAHVRARAK